MSSARKENPTTGVLWLRRDLRLEDNETLFRFSTECSHGTLVFIADASWNRAAHHRKTFQNQTLAVFLDSLQERGYSVRCYLDTQNTNASEIFEHLYREIPFQHIYTQHQVAWDENQETQQVKEALRRVAEHCGKSPPEWHVFETGSLIPTSLLPFLVNDTPELFTQYRKKVESHLNVKAKIPLPVPAPPQAPQPLFSSIKSPLPLPQEKVFRTPFFNFPVGESLAKENFYHYVWDLKLPQSYKETRNGMMDYNDSTKLSPALSLGALSPKTIYHEICQFERMNGANESTYWIFFELLWRDYFRLIGQKWGSRLFSSMQQSPSHKKNKGIHADFDYELYRRWTQGNTPNDFINANMRELNQTGWMSNRGRQNVASYLSKTLGLPWQKGAEYFEQHLIDYDPTSNWGNWAYLAGVGQDARDREFNPDRQAQQYDPDGAYRNRWLRR